MKTLNMMTFASWKKKKKTTLVLSGEWIKGGDRGSGETSRWILRFEGGIIDGVDYFPSMKNRPPRCPRSPFQRRKGEPGVWLSKHTL